jgi:hypothetical protein
MARVPGKSRNLVGGGVTEPPRKRGVLHQPAKLASAVIGVTPEAWTRAARPTKLDVDPARAPSQRLVDVRILAFGGLKVILVEDRPRTV